jgi:hypothetical protein
MYLVKFKTSGIIAYRSLDREQAKLWTIYNDIMDADGNPVGLYRIEKVKNDRQTESKQAQEGV